VVELYETWGRHHYDEVVTQLDHALQCAALAAASDASDELVAAALLHDIGHLLHLASVGHGAVGDGAVRTGADLGHEQVGSEHLTGVMPPGVTMPIALHVAAKRYRCAVDPSEVDRLSVGSQRSLLKQGGPMSAAEVAAFEADPHHADAVALRGWDDAGKVVGLTIAPFDTYLPLLARVSIPPVL
jgi:predicted HD phosphohydrolase